MGSFIFNKAKFRKEHWTTTATDFLNWVRDTGGNGSGTQRLRMLILCATNPLTEPDLVKTHATVAACLSAGTYDEYDGTGYPAMASRPFVPQLTVTQDNTNHEADIDPPAGAPGEMSFGSPLASSKAIRALLVYEHFSDSNDALNFPAAFIDQGTIIGQNGNGQPMTVSWSGAFASLRDV